MLGTIGSPYGAPGHFISRGEYSGVNVKCVNGGDKKFVSSAMGMGVSRVSVDSFCFKKYI